MECAAELQVLHKHSESGLTEKKLLKKAKALLPIGSWGPAELSKGLQQVWYHTSYLKKVQQTAC